MPYPTSGSLPHDTQGFASGSGYAPNTGTIAIQLDTPSLDNSGQISAPVMAKVLLRDASNNIFGTQGNPLATNQVVGIPIYATTTGAAGAAANASLAAVANKTTYINGFYVAVAHTASGTIAGQVTLSLDGGTTTHMNFLIAVSTTYPGVVQIDFPDPIPTTAQNTAIKVSLPTLSGGGISSLSLFGYQL